MNTTSNESKSSPENGGNGGTHSVSSSILSAFNQGFDVSPKPVEIIIADSEAIFRVGMAKIFALENDLKVVAQAENLPQALTAVSTIPADVILFEAGLSANPSEALSEVSRRALRGAKVVLVTQRAGEEETVEYLRRGVRGILSRSVSPDLLVRCVRKVAAGETWLDSQGVNWVIEAYRSQATQGGSSKHQLRLSDKEMLIISGVTQGLKNKDIAQEVGTTEQVVKNYLRKIYDKLGVTDRLELALYSMHHRLLDGYVPRSARDLNLGAAMDSVERQQAASASASVSASAALLRRTGRSQTPPAK